MEFLRAQSKYISEQLRTMSGSQRIAIGLLVVVLIGGMFQMMRWAGQPEWTPVIDQALKPDEVQSIQGALTLVSIETRVEGDRVMIRGGDDDRQRAQAVLAQRGAMPRDTSLSYKNLMEDSSQFISNQESVWRHDRGLETELSEVLRRFQGIRDANVFIEKPKKRPLGRKSEARASVHVTLDRGDALDKKQITAIADLVAGAVDGLAVTDVKITDGLQSYRAPDPNNMMATDLLDRQRALEDWYTKKIYDQFSHIRGLIVNVHARLRDSDQQTQELKLGPPVVMQETEKTEESTGRAQATGPGVLPNRGQAINDAGPGSSHVKAENLTDLSNERDRTRVDTVTPAGYLRKMTASVNVPHSYLEQIFRKQQDIEPDQKVEHTQIVDLATIELPKIRDQLKTLLQAEDDDQVAVAWYYDAPQDENVASVLAGPPNYFALAKDYGPQAGLALLALFSLFTVFRIAKKAQSSVVATKANIQKSSSDVAALADELPSVGGGPVTVGEAEAMHSAIVGHEVDENLVRTQQIVEQIGQLVKEDPDSAASVVQTWLQDEH
ncbi:MAG: hypothetical protein MI923_17760 [Phycisphaerales bacterium]|nr:hypothetical protein [Phycisphaerales bacterium]